MLVAMQPTKYHFLLIWEIRIIRKDAANPDQHENAIRKRVVCAVLWHIDFGAALALADVNEHI